MSREQVARNQRARLYGAMIESVHERGFERTAVADLIALAGVSRRAFYEHFNDKTQCLLAAHNSVVGSARHTVVTAWASQHGWSNRLHSACQRLFEQAATQPKHAHFVLVDSVGTMPGARERMRISNAAFERPLQHALAAQAGDRSRPSISATAIAGGIRQLLFARVSEGRADELVTLPEEVLDWIESHRASPTRGAPAKPANPPRPATALPMTADARRQRVSEAMLNLTARLGYASITDAQLAKAAGISTHAFHKLFADKEACFIALRRELTETVLASASEAMAQDDSWPGQVHRAMTALSNALALNQAIARLTFVDVLDTGPAAVQQQDHPIVELVGLLASKAPRPRCAQRVAPDLAVGAISAIVGAHAASGTIPRLPAAADWLAFTLLAPYIGAADALAEIAGARARNGAY